MKKVRWGLVSTASINEKVIPAIRASSFSELSAVASRDHSRSNAYAQYWSIPHAFGSYQEMYDSGLVDAVYISLPNHLHAEWTIRALNAGIHVLCEKPFAITLADVDAMILASSQTGRLLSEAFMYRHHPQTKIAGDFVSSGSLGQLSHASGTFTFSIDNYYNVRMLPELGGGCLWDVGVYPISLAQYLFGGSPSEVFGMQRVGITGVDETFVGQMCYPGGEFAQTSSSFRSEFHNYFELVGSQGRLVFTRPFKKMEKDSHLLFYPKQSKPQEIPVPKRELYIGEIDDMAAAILHGSPLYLTLVETRNQVRTVLALYESARMGVPVSLL